MIVVIAVLVAVTVAALVVGPSTFGRAARTARVTVSLADRLARAQLPVTAGRWRLVVVVTALVVGGVLWVATGALGPALVPAVVAGLLPGAWLRRAERRQLDERTEAWPEALRDLVGHVRTSATVRAGLVELGETGPLPLRDVWRRFGVNAATLGAPGAFAVVQAELADPISDRVVAVLREIEGRGGGEVALGVLAHVITVIADDVRLTREIVARQAETQIQGVVCALMPFGLLLALVSMSAEFRAFYSSPAGVVVVAVGAGMAYGGWRWMARLARQHVEPRFLAGDSGGVS